MTMQHDIPSSEELDVMEIALCVLLKEDLPGLRSKILQMRPEEFALCTGSIGKFSQNLSLSTYKKYRPYSAQEELYAKKWKEKTLSRKMLRHVLYFPGGDAVHCGPEFLEALIYDFVSYSLAASRLISNASGTRSLDSPLDSAERLVRENLYAVMQQCRRLRENPRLFPNEVSKTEFFLKISKISESFHSLVEISRSYDKILKSACQPIAKIDQPISTDFKEKHFISPSSEVVADSSENTISNVPEFLPDKAHARDGPWLNWLQNSASSYEGCIAIQQKIPRVGDKLTRQICLLYDAISEDFTQNEFMGEDEGDINYADVVPSPGHDYAHFTWSGFRTVPVYELGFQNGKRKTYDSNGNVTIEHLSRLLCKLKGKGYGIQQQSSNCPYFRFALAYRI
ncbi:hypothetical protein GLAREA_11997 [Glarea lozoyensis ATCC 20868]|uniref:Uncharacterized protein n=1 Tax=Glarea lozoyensis (strain ATCC 20868 / MF5171) TaxID=1116229 RepID=S3D275_GLAL2|nr:uncharacterized protein GLAREA_11997 [Glarea lozoyensis ATCC 20868]EPE31915.1 hypothetical protein GLAREA_11997 [Glarea lozoyensis ATCC 20868]